ncbi:DUF1275 domain-containing protein [Providencia rustigianii]|uniref:YoaK family protein n=1 Tax=Providencia rustigianii TaxID=158850 RepID=UPI000F6ED5F0|nr:YoaK family protein [Providencia rustigianii]MTC59911.1 DUF1275 domain-containing protein [Providencia rustigianii]VEH57177.1 Predicted membrane protein [Providencia rustigianii]
MIPLFKFEPQSHIPFVLLLTFIGGFVDACSFVIFEVFTGHLTGNSILSMIYLAKMDISMLLLSVISILGFFVGTFFGSWVRLKHSALVVYRFVLGLVFLIFSCVFLLYFFAQTFYSPDLAIFMISFSMGIQNGYFNKAGTVDVHSTYVTGMTTSCINAFLKNIPGDDSKKVLLLAVLSFISGGLAGGILSVNYHFIAFSVVLILLACAFFYSLTLCDAPRKNPQ